MPRIGPNRLRILALVMEGTARNRPVSLLEIMRRIGLASPNGVAGHLAALRKAGLVTWSPGRCRTLVATCRFVPATELGEDRRGGE